MKKLKFWLTPLLIVAVGSIALTTISCSDHSSIVSNNTSNTTSYDKMTKIVKNITNNFSSNLTMVVDILNDNSVTLTNNESGTWTNNQNVLAKNSDSLIVSKPGVYDFSHNGEIIPYFVISTNTLNGNVSSWSYNFLNLPSYSALEWSKIFKTSNLAIKAIEYARVINAELRYENVHYMQLNSIAFYIPRLAYPSIYNVVISDEVKNNLFGLTPVTWKLSHIGFLPITSDVAHIISNDLLIVGVSQVIYSVNNEIVKQYTSSNYNNNFTWWLNVSGKNGYSQAFSPF